MKPLLLNFFIFFLISIAVEFAKLDATDKLTTYEKIAEVIKLANEPFSKEIGETSLSNWLSEQWENVENLNQGLKLPLNFTSTLIRKNQKNLDAISAYIKKGNGLTLTEFSRFLSKKKKFFPQAVSSGKISFDPNWITLVIYYMKVSSLIHLELMDPSRTEKTRLNICAFHHELGLLRDDIIGAAKQIYKLRYQHTIKGAGVGSLKDLPKGILLDSSIIPKYLKESSAHGYLSFSDTVYNDTVSLWLPHICHYYFDLIVKESISFMIERMTMFYNSLIGNNCDEIMVEDGCQCPKMIRSEEVQFFYKDDCFGELQDNGIKCKLPCLDYDGNKTYTCVVGEALETGSWYVENLKETVKLETLGRHSSRGICNPLKQSDWDRCMSVKNLNKNLILKPKRNFGKILSKNKSPVKPSHLSPACLAALCGGGK